MKKNILRIHLIVVSTLLLSCGKLNGAEISTTEAGNILIVTEEFSAVILTTEFMDKNTRTPSPPEYWTPEVEQILYIEANLEEYLSQNDAAFNSKRAPSKEKLTTYIRQYTGINYSEGKRGILGVFYCAEYSKSFDWINQIIDVDGGGDCIFGVWFDPETREFISVGANSLR